MSAPEAPPSRKSSVFPTLRSDSFVGGLDESEQNRLFWQRSVLLTGGARGFGIAAVVGATISLLTPGALPFLDQVVSLVAVALLFACALITNIFPNGYWVAASYCTGHVAMLTLWRAPDGDFTNALVVTLIFLAGWGTGHIAVILVGTWGQIAILATLAAITLFHLILILTVFSIPPLIPIAVTVGSWGISAAFGYWLNRTFPQIMRRMDGLGRAHRAEIRASELEFHRRREARLLHDTALATLSLLAHSGVGVASDALRAQAASDRDLLARLARGEDLHPEASGDYSLRTTAPTEPGAGVTRLQERFASLGLTLEVYGSAESLDESASGELLLLAVSECVENTRRHSGVATATLTLSETSATLRALVTDTGIGFDPDVVTAGRLGFAQSVVGRVESIGGKVRLFSAPGSGTTVMMEVPR